MELFTESVRLGLKAIFLLVMLSPREEILAGDKNSLCQREALASLALGLFNLNSAAAYSPIRRRRAQPNSLW